MKHLYIWVMLCISTIAMAQQDLTVTVIDGATKKIVPNYPITLQNTSRNIL
jgi:hypothetical protein